MKAVPYTALDYKHYLKKAAGNKLLGIIGAERWNISFSSLSASALA